PAQRAQDSGGDRLPPRGERAPAGPLAVDDPLPDAPGAGARAEGRAPVRGGARSPPCPPAGGPARRRVTGRAPMRRALTGIAIAAGLVAFGRASADTDMEGNVQFLVGQRYLDDFWKPLNDQPMFGVEVDFAPKGSPIHVALSASGSYQKQTVAT